MARVTGFVDPTKPMDMPLTELFPQQQREAYGALGDFVFQAIKDERLNKGRVGLLIKLKGCPVVSHTFEICGVDLPVDVLDG